MRKMMRAGAAGIAVLLLVACGDKDRESVQFQGQVADGALVGARVFQDLDSDLLWDPEEPHVMTDREGRYVLTGQPGNQAIVAEVLPTTIDLDTGLAVGQAYTLTAPPGASSFISPISTLVAALQRQYPAMSQSEALAFVHGLLQEAEPALAELPREALLQNFLATGRAELHGVARILARQLQLYSAHAEEGGALPLWVSALQGADETSARNLWGRRETEGEPVLDVAAVHLPERLLALSRERVPLAALEGGLYPAAAEVASYGLADACRQFVNQRQRNEGNTWMDVQGVFGLHVYTGSGVHVAIDQAPESVDQPAPTQVRCQWWIDGHTVRMDNYFSLLDLSGSAITGAGEASDFTFANGANRIAGLVYWTVDGRPARVSQMIKVPVPNATWDDFLRGCPTEVGTADVCEAFVMPGLTSLLTPYQNALAIDGLSGVIANDSDNDIIALFMPLLSCPWQSIGASPQFHWLEFSACASYNPVAESYLQFFNRLAGVRVLANPGTADAMVWSGAYHPDDIGAWKRLGDGYRYSYLNRSALQQLEARSP